MSVFELNKIAGALLAAALTAGIATTISNLVYTEQPVPDVLLAAAVPDAEEPAPAEDQVTPAVLPIADRLAAADVARGEREGRKCAACHVFSAGAPDRVGPNLYNVVGRQFGASESFRYSSSMAGREDRWDYETLDQFLANPKTFLPGTSMSFAGVRDPEVRAAVIAWMRLQADNPAPLPNSAN